MQRLCQLLHSQVGHRRTGRMVVEPLDLLRVAFIGQPFLPEGFRRACFAMSHEKTGTASIRVRLCWQHLRHVVVEEDCNGLLHASCTAYCYWRPFLTINR